MGSAFMLLQLLLLVLLLQLMLLRMLLLQLLLLLVGVLLFLLMMFADMKGLLAESSIVELFYGFHQPVEQSQSGHSQGRDKVE